MDIDTYTKILLKQQESMTPEMLEAIKTQGELHIICEAKQNRFYELENKYRILFSQGVELLLDHHPELQGELPNRETKAEQILAIWEEVNNSDSNCKKITKLMKTIDSDKIEAEYVLKSAGEEEYADQNQTE